MRWTPGDRTNVEDFRGRSGGGFGIPLGIGGVLVLLVGSWLTGVNLFSLVGTGGSSGLARAINPQKFVCFAMPFNRPAACRNRPRARSIVPPMRGSTSIGN